MTHSFLPSSPSHSQTFAIFEKLGKTIAARLCSLGFTLGHYFMDIYPSDQKL